MDPRPPHDDRDELSLSEKIQRVQDLWDDIADDAARLSLSPEQRAEVERRLSEYERSPRDHETWDSVKRRLLEER